MKKLVLGTIAIGMTINYANAWSIEKKVKSGHNQYDVTVICDNGLATIITENTYTKNYYANGRMYQNLNSAVKKACTPKKQLYKLKKEAIVCKSRQELKMLLAEDGTVYDMRKINLQYGSKGKCFLAGYNSKVELLKEYKNETFKKEYDNGKKKWTKTVNLCDTYFKVKAGGNIYYIRKSDIQF